MVNNTDKETANKTPNVLQRVQRKCEKKSYIEESDKEEILTKKKKQQEMKKVPNPKLSWFEENVIKKNIEERKKMEKALGLEKLADDLDLMYS